MNLETENKNIFCKYCNTTKPENDFYFYRQKKCKSCCNEYNYKNPPTIEKKKLRNKNYYLKNKEKIIQHNTK